MRDPKVWLTLVLFQVAFGLTVFAVTRHYYLVRQPAAAPPAWALALRAAPPSAPPRAASPSAPPAAASPSAVSPSAAAATPAAGALPAPASPPPSSDPVAMSARAEDAFNAGRYDEAAQLFKELLAIDPRNVELHNELGLTLHYSGRSEQALQALAAGLAIDPSHQRSWLTTGFVNLRLGNTAEARAALIKARDAGSDAKIRESAEKMLAGLPQ
jgi:tetratricopeptide (TPR) repeat protein